MKKAFYPLMLVVGLSFLALPTTEAATPPATTMAAFGEAAATTLTPAQIAHRRAIRHRRRVRRRLRRRIRRLRARIHRLRVALARRPAVAHPPVARPPAARPGLLR